MFNDEDTTLEILKTIGRANKELIFSETSPKTFKSLNHLQYIPLDIPETIDECLSVQNILVNPSILNDIENIDEAVIIDNEIYLMFTHPLCKILFTKLTSKKSDGFSLIELIYKICLITKDMVNNNYYFHDNDKFSEIVISNINDIDANAYGITQTNLNYIYIDDLIYDPFRKILHVNMDADYYDYDEFIPEDIIINLQYTDQEYFDTPALLNLADFLEFPNYANNFRYIDDVVISNPNITIMFTYALRKILFIKRYSKTGYTLRNLINIVCKTYQKIYQNRYISEDPAFQYSSNKYTPRNSENRYGILIPNIKNLHLSSFNYDSSSSLFTIIMQT